METIWKPIMDLVIYGDHLGTISRDHLEIIYEIGHLTIHKERLETIYGISFVWRTFGNHLWKFKRIQ